MTGGSTLLAFDFDGTLAPIRDDPSQVQLDRGAAALLAETTQMEGVVVAIVSGRDADDLTTRVNAPGAYIIASHSIYDWSRKLLTDMRSTRQQRARFWPQRNTPQRRTSREVVAG